jgi:subtilase family serine protease
LRRTRATVVTIALCAACSGGRHGADPLQGIAATAPVAPASGLRVLPGHVSNRRGSDLGRMDPSARLEGMTLVLTPSGSRSQRESLLAALQDPGSPLYHEWLTPEDYAARFGASEEDVARVTQWLAQQGFEVDGASRPRTSLRFSGSVDQLERAFHTEMHRYDTRGETHFALAVEPSIPTAFGDAVAGLRNVHDYHSRPLSHPAPAFHTAQGYQLAPADWATIYGVAPLYARPVPLDGTGQKIAIVGASTILESDIASFRSLVGLPPGLPMQTQVPGSGFAVQNEAGYFQEATLDVEWSGAIARSATIEYVYVGEGRNHSVDDALLYAFENAVAPIVAFGYAGCEAEYTNVDAVDFSWEGELASMLGITFVAASGDGAAAACDVGGAAATSGLSVALPASIPGALAVGGTSLAALPRSQYFDSTGMALGYIPETGWNDTAASDAIMGGTGGASALYAKPFWQVGVTTNDGARDVPDVAFSASRDDVPYLVVADGQPDAYGGTSCGTPSFAGVLAILNQALGAPQPGLGNVGPILYALAGNPAAAGVFHDVTAGGNVVPCQPGSTDCPTSAPFEFGYLAAPGYDLVSGNGSVDANALVQAWSALRPTGTSLVGIPEGTTEGSPLTLTAAISSKGTVAMAGDVIFYYSAQWGQGSILSIAPLGVVPVTPTTSGGAAAATAELDTHAPPGFSGTSTIVAFYSGDRNYLASWSAGQAFTATSTFAISPVISVATAHTQIAFTSTSGQSPVTWSIFQDDSGGSIVPGTGLYTAGDPMPGSDLIVARDAYGAQAIARVTVTPADAGAPPLPPGNPVPDDDAGAPNTWGSSPAAETDAAIGDDAPANAAAPDFFAEASGSACAAAGAPGTAGSPAPVTVGAALAVLLSLGARRLRDRDPSWSRTCARATRRGPRRGSSPS